MCSLILSSLTGKYSMLLSLLEVDAPSTKPRVPIIIELDFGEIYFLLNECLILLDSCQAYRQNQMQTTVQSSEQQALICRDHVITFSQGPTASFCMHYGTAPAWRQYSKINSVEPSPSMPQLVGLLQLLLLSPKLDQKKSSLRLGYRN